MGELVCVKSHLEKFLEFSTKILIIYTNISLGLDAPPTAKLHLKHTSRNSSKAIAFFGEKI